MSEHGESVTALPPRDALIEANHLTDADLPADADPPPAATVESDESPEIDPAAASADAAVPSPAGRGRWARGRWARGRWARGRFPAIGRRAGLALLTLLAFGLCLAVVLDRRPVPRPRIEVIDPAGVLTTDTAELGALRAQAGGLGYPVTIIFAEATGSRADWQREVRRRAEPDRLVIGIGTVDRLVAVGRGLALPLSASEEQAIRLAALDPVLAGDYPRGAFMAVTQAHALGRSTMNPARIPIFDVTSFRLIVSAAAPFVVLILGSVIVHRRWQARTAVGVRSMAE